MSIRASNSRLSSSRYWALPWALGALGIFLLVTTTPVGSFLERSMVMHVLVEIPILIAVGIVAGALSKHRVKPLLEQINAGGIAGILLASFTLAFWMIPRWLDASLISETVAWAKYISLPMLVGMPLAWSWRALHPISRAVVKIEFLTMLFRLGWLYLISPDRLCNSYLLADQESLGRGFLAVGLALAITWLIPLFCGSSSQVGTAGSKPRTSLVRASDP